MFIEEQRYIKYRTGPLPLPLMTIDVCDSGASTANDDRTLAIVLGTVGGLLFIVLVIFVACYVTNRWPWLTASRRTRILRAEMALDDDSSDIRPSIFPCYPLQRLKPYRPSSEHAQLPSALEQSVIGQTELDTVPNQPTLVWHDLLVHACYQNCFTCRSVDCSFRTSGVPRKL